MKATRQLEGVEERHLGGQRHLVSGLVAGQRQEIFPTREGMEGKRGLEGAPSLRDKDQMWEQRPCPHPPSVRGREGVEEEGVVGRGRPCSAPQFPLRRSLPKSQDQASLPSPSADPKAALATRGTASIRGALQAQAKPEMDSGGLCRSCWAGDPAPCGDSEGTELREVKP